MSFISILKSNDFVKKGEKIQGHAYSAKVQFIKRE